jgi:hypothetical protein
MRALLGVRRGWSPSLALVLAALLLSGCTSESPAPRAAGPSLVPLQEIDLSGVSAVRAPFCEALDETALSAVLGGKPRRDTSYGPGDRVALTPALRDVAHEYGCAFRKRGIIARSWLFAQPVTRGQARSYVGERRHLAGCSPAGVLEFGSPGVVEFCRPARHAGPGGGGAAKGTSLVTMSGLFGSGYLTCQVSATPESRLSNDDLLTRAERWCASVATTIGTPS